MTEKRFTVEIIENDVFIHQEGANHYLGHKDYVNADMVCDLLNEQHEQIEDLKDTNVRCCNEYSYFHKRMMELEKENGQLKQTNQRLNDELQDCMGKLALKR